MTALLATLALAAATGFVLGYAFGSKPDAPVKRALEQINSGVDVELYQEVVSENEALTSHVLNLRAVLIDIRNQGIASKSGTARSMAAKAKAALK